MTWRITAYNLHGYILLLTQEKFSSRLEIVIYLAPSLILLYAAIDIMAWLNRDKKHAAVQRCDFLCWVDTYLLPISKQSYTAKDLYGARCSVIHSYSAESKLSREGKAAKLNYSLGPEEKENLQKDIDFTKELNTKAIDLKVLFTDTKKAINQFLDDEGNNKLV